MKSYYSNINEKKIGEAGCFCFEKNRKETKKKAEKWLEKKVPLHFFLMFLIFFCGAILSVPRPLFLSENSGLWLASLVFVSDTGFEAPPNFNGDIESQFSNQFFNGAKLPLSNNVAYALPLSPEKEKPNESEPAKPKPVAQVAAMPGGQSFDQSRTNQAEYKDGKYIEVDVSEQTMRIWGDGELKGIYKVSTGKPGYRTPTGNFKVLRKSANVWSRACQCWMPYATEFKSGYFIHELPLWPGGAREGENHLGLPVSHGCVRLGIGPAKEVFDFAEVGMPVIIRQ